MKISEFLKNRGCFSNEIKARFQNGQIKINGDTVKTDIDLNVKDPTPLINEPFEAGDWIFVNLMSRLPKERKEILCFITSLFGIETLFSGDCQINNKPVEEILPELNILKNHILLKTSKKEQFILKKLNINIQN